MSIDLPQQTMACPDVRFHPFRQGWILAKPSAPMPAALADCLEDWPRHDVAGYTLSHNKELPYFVGRHGPAAVHAMGLLLDVGAFDEEERTIVGEMARDLHEGGWPAFYRRLKRLAGRHVIIVEYDGVSIVLDATGMMPAAHGTLDGETVVSSHPRLVAEIVGAGISDFARDWWAHPAFRRGGAFMPGLLTAFEGVEILTANQRFDLANRRMHRFYPDSDLPSREPRDIADDTLPMLVGQLETLTARRLAISLTGGIDSRVTLACSRTIANCATYFTYIAPNRKSMAIDGEVAGNIGRTLGLNYLQFAYDGTPSAEFETAKQFCDGDFHPTSTLWQMSNHLGQGALHVRSTILEIARGFYLSKARESRASKFTASTLSGFFRRDRKEAFAPIFEDFIAKTTFDRAHFRNHHFSDLFYWEHRMAGFSTIFRMQSGVLDTYVIYNCRLILEQMLSTSVERRIARAVMRSMIEAAWPALVDFPVFSGSTFIDLRLERSR